MFLGVVLLSGGLEDMVEKSFKEMKTAIIIPDLHVPYVDEESFDAVVKYVKNKKPDVIVQLGDFYDCYGISKFDKDPKRIDSLQEEIDYGAKLWTKLKKASPKSKLVMLEGNHERRLPKTLMKNNPGMYSLNALKPQNLFGLKDLGVEFYPAEKTFYLNNQLIVTHGGVDDGGKLSQKAGYSARGNLEKFNISGISGHSHRMGYTTKTSAQGMVQWHEIGCLMNLKPDYVKFPDWQQGFATVYYSKNRFHIVPTTIVNKEFIADGKLYK